MTERTPIYERITRTLAGLIESGEFGTNGRIYSIAEIRRRFGVTVTTAQRVIDELERLGRVRRRKGSGVYVNQEPAGTPSRPRTWAYVMPAINKPSLYVQIIRGIEDCAHEHEVNLIVANSDDDPEKQDRILRRMLESGVDGIIITPHMKPYPPLEVYLRLLGRRVPFVFCNRGVSGIDVPLVAADHALGGLLATRHLLGLGYRRIGVVSPAGSTAATERFGGYLKALDEAGLAPDERLVLWIDRFEGMIERVRAAARKRLQQETPPEAVFACSDLAAYGYYRALQDLGLRCPEDVALVGHDDIDPPRGFDLQLTTVAYPAYESGRECARILLRMHAGEALKGETRLILASRLVVRRSCGQYLRAPERASTAPGPTEAAVPWE